jgi:hypothetical protein
MLDHDRSDMTAPGRPSVQMLGIQELRLRAQVILRQGLPIRLELRGRNRLSAVTIEARFRTLLNVAVEG